MKTKNFKNKAFIRELLLNAAVLICVTVVGVMFYLASTSDIGKGY